MGKLGKISTIKREYSNSQLQTMQSELAKRGLTRVPGTGVFKFPYKEISGVYRTGLDPEASYIKRIQDPLEKELEIKRVTDLKVRLESELRIDLSPRSLFWNYGLATSNDDQRHVQPVKLMDGDNYYDLSVPFQELAFSWLRVHPTIASSYQAWERERWQSISYRKYCIGRKWWKRKCRCSSRLYRNGYRTRRRCTDRDGHLDSRGSLASLRYF